MTADRTTPLDHLPADLRGPVPVMLSRATDQVPQPQALRGGTVYEPKWDGYRLVLVHDRSGVTAWSRQGKDLSARFPDVVAAATSQLPTGSVVDGEVVIWHGGRLSFDALQGRLTASAAQLAARVTARPASYLAFDALAAHGEDLRGRPWQDRRTVLEALAPWQPPLQLSPATRSREQAIIWFEDWRPAGIEGLVAKGVESRYEPGGRGWVKVKNRHTQEVVIGAIIGDRTCLAVALRLADDSKRKAARQPHHAGVAVTDGSTTGCQRTPMTRFPRTLRPALAPGHAARRHQGGPFHRAESCQGAPVYRLTMGAEDAHSRAGRAARHADLP